MSLLNRNNALVYMGVPLGGIAAETDVASVVGIISRFDVLVVAQHTGTNLTALQELAALYLAAHPTGKVFGYCTWSTLAAAQASMAQWQSDLGTSLGGLYFNAFDTAVRADQNTLINAAHVAAVPLAIAATGTSCFKMFETLGTDPITKLGAAVTIRDLVFLDGFYIQDQNVAAPVNELPEHAAGQLTYLSTVIANGGYNIPQTTPVPINVGIVGLIGAGTSTTINSTAFLLALNLANTFKLDALGTIPFDRGATSLRYFEGATANTFAS